MPSWLPEAVRARPEQALTLTVMLGVTVWAMVGVELAERKQLQRLDEQQARNDPRHRAKRFGERVNGAMRDVWWSVSRRCVGQRKRTKAERELHKLTWTARR